MSFQQTQGGTIPSQATTQEEGIKKINKSQVMGRGITICFRVHRPMDINDVSPRPRNVSIGQDEYKTLESTQMTSSITTSHLFIIESIEKEHPFDGRERKPVNLQALQFAPKKP